jgi:hypothetical protein
MSAALLPLRNFPDHINTLADQWITMVVNGEDWTATGRRYHGISLPYEVVNKQRVLAVLKPGPSGRSQCKPSELGCEKIASDLAYLLELPVPPVVLSQAVDRQGAPPYWVALSAICFDVSLQLNQVWAMLERNQQTHCDRLASATMIFDLWIGNVDRDERNIIVHMSRGGQPWRGAGIVDHSRSLIHCWESVYERDFNDLRIYRPALIDFETMQKTVEKIVGLPESELERIIDRIPPEVLGGPAKTVITDQLLSRRQRLTTYIERYGGMGL